MDEAGKHGTLREAAMKSVEATHFFPAWGRPRLEAMIKNRPDWCVSRQRNWGVPMPLFVHKESGALHPRTQELLEQVAQRVEQAGIEAWFSLDPAELLGDEAAYRSMATAKNPYGDGYAAERIVQRMRGFFSVDAVTAPASPALQPELKELARIAG
jgi:isoleucyl-tRNA synthetase